MGYNGLAAALAESDASRLLTESLTKMRHRAPAGYRVFLRDGRLPTSPEVPSLPPSDRIIAGCLRRPRIEPDERFIHGTFYLGGLPPLIDVPSVEAGLRNAATKLGRADGSYAFVTPFGEGLLFGRDPMGQKPLYFQRTQRYLGIASEPEGLPGPAAPTSIKPGRVYYSDLHRHASRIFAQPAPTLPPPGTLEEAAEGVRHLLLESLGNRVRGKAVVAIASSGGLDSSLLAFLLARRCRVKLFAVYAEGSRDALEAKKLAETMHLDLQETLVDEEVVTRVAPWLRTLHRGGGPMDLSIATGIHLAARAAAEAGFDELFLGQLADELFGGYARYLQALRSGGEAAAAGAMETDVRFAHRSNLERDERAASPFLDLVLPYGYLPLVQYALRIPVPFKVDRESGARKLVLRRVAAVAGLPQEICFGPKRALQYSSGLQKIVTRVI